MKELVFGQLLGPQGMKERMQEIQGQLNDRFAPPRTSFQPTLDEALHGSQPVPLSGDIGGDGPMSPFSPGTSVEPPPAYRQLIRDAAGQQGLDPSLLEAVIKQESDFNPNARSSVGAMGLTQLMPGTASGLGVTDPFDPAQSINGGAKYLRAQLDKFGTLPEALAAYNAGPGAVIRHNGIPPYSETRKYVGSVLSHYAKLKGGG